MSSGLTVYCDLPSAAFTSSTVMPAPFGRWRNRGRRRRRSSSRAESLPARAVAQVPERVDVRADVIAEDDEVARREPVDAMLGRADALGKLRPTLVHCQGRAHDPGKRHHVVVDRHAQINQSSCSSVMSP